MSAFTEVLTKASQWALSLGLTVLLIQYGLTKWVQLVEWVLQ